MATLILIVKFPGTDTTTLSVTQHATRAEAQAVLAAVQELVPVGFGVMGQIVGGV